MRDSKDFSSKKNDSLFVFEGKNDYLIIGLLFLLLAIFMSIAIIFSH